MAAVAITPSPIVVFCPALDVHLARILLENGMRRTLIVPILPLPFVPMCPAVESPLLPGDHPTTLTLPDMAPHDDAPHGEGSTRPAVWTFAAAMNTASSS